MQILTVDVGTGTQDIYLFRSGISIENGFKLVMPSPTMQIRHAILEATQRGDRLLLSGWMMGGGPCHWAAESHLDAGLELFATPQAARTFNDDLDWVEKEMGVRIVGEDETEGLKDITEIQMRDFDFPRIAAAFTAFGVDLDPQAVAVAVFDHGEAPPGYSDRQFRFDYLERRIQERNSLTAFAYISTQIPTLMTRMQAVAASAGTLDCPLIVMDTAPAAVLGATLDARVAERKRTIVANVGNFHTLAFRLGPPGIEGVFEHHTGFLTCQRIDDFLLKLANGSLSHEEIFEDHGHGALIIQPDPLPLQDGPFGVAITGPRRQMMQPSSLRPHFAVPFGDMMITGCFGLLTAVADLLPGLSRPIRKALDGAGAQTSPWEVEG
jgi:uncharacterized protein (DUF1786 family)